MLIVEDGSVVTDANTYLDEADANLILADFGLPALVSAEANLRAAARYLDSFRDRYQGTKVSPTQSLQFPRVNVLIDCNLQASDVIPNDLKIAQALAASKESLGNPLFKDTDGKTITSKSIAGQISVNYSDNGLSGTIYTEINAYLTVLFTAIHPSMKLIRA